MFKNTVLGYSIQVMTKNNSAMSILSEDCNFKNFNVTLLINETIASLCSSKVWVIMENYYLSQAAYKN